MRAPPSPGGAAGTSEQPPPTGATGRASVVAQTCSAEGVVTDPDSGLARCLRGDTDSDDDYFMGPGGLVGTGGWWSGQESPPAPAQPALTQPQTHIGEDHSALK